MHETQSVHEIFNHPCHFSENTQTFTIHLLLRLRTGQPYFQLHHSVLLDKIREWTQSWIWFYKAVISTSGIRSNFMPSWYFRADDISSPYSAFTWLQRQLWVLMVYTQSRIATNSWILISDFFWQRDIAVERVCVNTVMQRNFNESMNFSSDANEVGAN